MNTTVVSAGYPDDEMQTFETPRFGGHGNSNYGENTWFNPAPPTYNDTTSFPPVPSIYCYTIGPDFIVLCEQSIITLIYSMIIPEVIFQKKLPTYVC